MNESLNIQLNAGSKSILKLGFVVRSGLILLLCIGVVLFGLQIFRESIITACISFVIGIFLFRIFFKLLDAAFFKETLIVTKQNITIIHKTFSNTDEHIFPLDEINYLGFSEQHYTSHPMDNPVVDFTGLAVQEKELQYVIDEGNIKIATDKTSIKFGKNMPSWDVEDVVEQIEEFTGRKFTKQEAVFTGLAAQSDETFTGE